MLVDLGSQVSVIKESDAKRLGLMWGSVDGPYLRSLGNVPHLPLGRTTANIEVRSRA